MPIVRMPVVLHANYPHANCPHANSPHASCPSCQLSACQLSACQLSFMPIIRMPIVHMPIVRMPIVLAPSLRQTSPLFEQYLNECSEVRHNKILTVSLMCSLFQSLHFVGSKFEDCPKLFSKRFIYLTLIRSSLYVNP